MRGGLHWGPMPPSDSPLALLGYPTSAARALRDLGLVALALPTDDLKAVLAACHTLHFSGALVHASLEAAALDAAHPDRTAQRVRRVDAISFAGGAHGTFAFSDALSDALEASGYATRGASAVMVGLDAHDLALALPLARLGFTDLGVAADSTPEAERAARDVPAGVRVFPMSRRDPSLANLAERSDLVILTAGSLPAGVLQPYHTLIDLTGQVRPGSVAASVLDLGDLPARRLARQVMHATGQRLHAEELTGMLHALT